MLLPFVLWVNWFIEMYFMFTGNPKTWMASAFENPYPVHYNLRSILDLFKPEYFRNTPDVKYKKIKRGLRNFLQVCIWSQLVWSSNLCESSRIKCVKKSLPNSFSWTDRREPYVARHDSRKCIFDSIITLRVTAFINFLLPVPLGGTPVWKIVQIWL